MKKKSALIILLSSFFLTKLNAQKIGANITYATFTTPENKSYVETYMTIGGNTITYIKNKNGKKSGAVEITLLLKKDTTVTQFDKYLLSSPEVNDTDKIAFNLVDQKRFPVSNGNYILEITLKDANKAENKATASMPVVVDYKMDSITISDIELVESYKKTAEPNIFSKSGYDLVPYTLDFFPTEMDKIIFYSEVYNASKVFGEDDFLLNYSIKKSNSSEVVFNLNRFTKQKPKPVNVVFAELDIKDLPSGNYDLSIEVKNKKNELLSEKRFFFQRSNKNSTEVAVNLDLVDINNSFVLELSKDEIKYNLKSIYPIASENEKRYLANLLKGENVQLQKQFFLNFWTKRNSKDPSQAWQTYSEEVKKVNTAYSTQIDYGFETDRGRVYLQYGPPNDIFRSTREPGVLPYEIWQYYSLNENQRNVKFVFYNPDLVSNDFTLIHSEARGEVNDPRWKLKLNTSFNGNTNLDNTKVKGSYGSHINDFEINPK